MTLVDLIKVMDDDVKVVLYVDHNKVCDGEIVELLEHGFITPAHLEMIVNDVYFSIIYNAIAIKVE